MRPIGALRGKAFERPFEGLLGGFLKAYQRPFEGLPEASSLSDAFRRLVSSISKSHLTSLSKAFQRLKSLS